jgi:hypothetical protein
MDDFLPEYASAHMRKTYLGLTAQPNSLSEQRVSTSGCGRSARQDLLHSAGGVANSDRRHDFEDPDDDQPDRDDQCQDFDRF